MEAAHAWVFAVKPGGLRGSSPPPPTKLSLMMLPAEILKASYDSTKTEFMWRGDFIPSHTSEYTHSLPRCRETPVCNLGNYVYKT